MSNEQKKRKKKIKKNLTVIHMWTFKCSIEIKNQESKQIITIYTCTSGKIVIAFEFSSRHWAPFHDNFGSIVYEQHYWWCFVVFDFFVVVVVLFFLSFWNVRSFLLLPLLLFSLNLMYSFSLALNCAFCLYGTLLLRKKEKKKKNYLRWYIWLCSSVIVSIQCMST